MNGSDVFVLWLVLLLCIATLAVGVANVVLVALMIRQERDRG